LHHRVLIRHHAEGQHQQDAPKADTIMATFTDFSTSPSMRARTSCKVVCSRLGEGVGVSVIAVQTTDQLAHVGLDLVALIEDGHGLFQVTLNGVRQQLFLHL